MVRLLRKNRGQSTLEYAILIVVVIMALVAIQAYLSRGIQGRMRDSTDQLGDQYSAATGSYNYTTTTHAIVNEQKDAWSTTTEYKAQTSDRSGSESLGNFEGEYWQ